MAVKQTRLGFVIAGLLLGIFVAAIDDTIVATAMGTIIGHLGGLDKYVWVTSAYLVTQMAGMPIFGKLSDMYGRKRFFMFGLAVFVLGSILCGTAQNIVQLSIYRAIQGIGGGALMPIAFTILFDVFPRDKLGKMSGMFGAVFGLSSIIGPLLGSYITDYINWRWIFYINVPLGLVAFSFIAFFYRESLRHARQQIDWWGVLTLVPAVVCLMFGLQLGGHQYAWDSIQIISLFAGFVVFFGAFLYVETKAVEPILSYSMFKKRLFAGSNIVALLSGGAYVVAVLYMPLFVQGVLGGTATNSGLALLPMMLGSVFASQLGARLTSKVSYRNIMLPFMIIFALGIYLLSTLTPDSTRLMVTAYMVVMGLGIGATFSVLSMAAMHHFDETQRGSANSAMSFVRMLGITVGITVFGIIQRNLFKHELTNAFGGVNSPANAFATQDPHAILSPAVRVHIPAPVLDKLTTSLATSIAHTFVWTMIPALLALLAVFLMGNARWEGFKSAQRHTQEVPTSD